MSTQKETKINLLLQRLPSGTVATTGWLRSNGIGLSNVAGYVKRGWFDRLGVGAITRKGRNVEWQGAVYALQRQLGLSVHPGGKTALSLLGSLHYVPLGQPPATLFCRNKESLPKWFSQHDWSVKIHLVKSDLLGSKDDLGMTDVSIGEFSLRVSSHERAIFEYLHLLEDGNSGDEPIRIMEGLAWLRPDIIQQLLEACHSVKVKRLFLVLSDLCNHPWVKKLNLKRVDIGKGKRQFSKGGHLHQRYQITIPESWKLSEMAA